MAVVLTAPHRSAAQDEAPAGDAFALAEASAAAFVEAFNAGDANAIGKLFTEDASYSIGEGADLNGRSAIVATMKTFFEDAPGAEMAIEVATARFLTGEVLVEKGLATVFTDEGAETTRYTATHVKEADSWAIAELNEVLVAGDPAAEAMGSLSWLIGSWEVAAEGVDAQTTATWVLDGRFISRTSTIDRGDETPFRAVELIGYDASLGQIRSWTFDSEGGFGDGIWRADGNKWLVRSRATLPDGAQSSSQHVLTRVDEDSWGLETINRVLDGELLPSRDRLEIKRVAGDDSEGGSK